VPDKTGCKSLQQLAQEKAVECFKYLSRTEAVRLFATVEVPVQLRLFEGLFGLLQDERNEARALRKYKNKVSQNMPLLDYRAMIDRYSDREGIRTHAYGSMSGAGSTPTDSFVFANPGGS
jgi:hypothetical protein